MRTVFLPWDQTPAPYELLTDDDRAVLAEVGSFTLGRAVQTRSKGGVVTCALPDLEALLAPDCRATRRRFHCFIKHQRIQDANSRWWCSREHAGEKSLEWSGGEFSFSDSGLVHWSEGPIRLLRDEHGHPRALQARRIPVYDQSAGCWRHVWAFLEDDLREICRVILAEGVSDPRHEAGLGYADARKLGFGREELRLWAKPKDQGGEGITELGGQVLESWFEDRISAHRHIFPFKRFSKSQLQEVLTIRAAQANADPHKDWLTEQKAMKKYNKRGKTFIRRGDLPGWHKRCLYIEEGKLDAHFDGVQYRYDPEQLKRIVQALRTVDAPRLHPVTKEKCVRLHTFLDLAGGMTEQQVADLRKRNRKCRALGGRALRWCDDRAPARKNRHPKNYFYSERDGRQLGKWRAARRENPAQAARLAEAFSRSERTVVGSQVSDSGQVPASGAAHKLSGGTPADLRDDELSDRQRDILQVLLKSRAFDVDHRMTTVEISRQVAGPGVVTASFGRPIANLKHRGLVMTKEGRDGGCWLTASGRELIQSRRL
jgi:hypothetical protein